MSFENISLETVLEYQVWGNSTIAYILFLSFVIGSYIFGIFINMIIKGKLKKFAEKSETKLDDLIIGIIGGPFVLIVVLIGMSLGSKSTTGGFHDMIVQIYSALTYIAAAWILFRTIDGVNEHYLSPYLAKTETKVDDVLVPVIIRVVKVVLGIFVGLLALQAFGYAVGPIVNFFLSFAMMLLVTAAISTIWLFRSVIGGLLILFNKPFEEGDRISFGTLEGLVEKLEIHRIILRTDDGKPVSVPNHEFVTLPVKILEKAAPVVVAPSKPKSKTKSKAKAEEEPKSKSDPEAESDDKD